jgi:hypothetical protein
MLHVKGLEKGFESNRPSNESVQRAARYGQVNITSADLQHLPCSLTQDRTHTSMRHKLRKDQA